MTQWKVVRSLFPATKDTIYLNAASSSLCPTPVANAARDYYTDIETKGHAPWEKWCETIEKARINVAKYVDAKPEDIAFITSTSQGMNFATQIISNATKKKHIATPCHEFPSSVIPWRYYGFTIGYIDHINYTYPLKHVSSYLSSNTAALVASHVQFNTGARQNIAGFSQSCHENNTFSICNATQSFGALPISFKEWDLDILCANALKWTFCGCGIAIICISEEIRENYSLPMAGWQSVEDAMEMNNKSDKYIKNAAGLEVGATQFPQIFALGKSIELLSSIGIEIIEKRIMQLTDYIFTICDDLNIPIISPREEKYRSGIVAIQVPQAQRIQQKLEDHNIITSVRDGCLRISPHIYNNKEDIDTFASVLKTLL